MFGNQRAALCGCAACRIERPHRVLRWIAQVSVGSALLLYIVALVGICLSNGCGGNQRMKTIQTSVTAVDAARDGFIEFVRQHQTKMVADAPATADGKVKLEAELAAFKDKRDKVVEGFAIVYRALALAATKQDETSLSEALLAINDLFSRIVGLKNGDSP